MKCITCHKPILDGEPLYGLRSAPWNDEGQHYDCAFPNGYKDPMVEAREALKRLDAARKALRELEAEADPVIDSTATTPQRRRRK